MDAQKDIRFTEKKVDESWKDDISRETKKSKTESSDQPKTEREEDGGSPFIALISSLGMQALIQLGEMEDPGTGVRSQDLAGVQATINLLMMLQEKTKGNLTKQESRVMDSLVYDLQLKFVEYGRAQSAARPLKNRK